MRLIDDWKTIWKRWSVHILAIGTVAQTVWATMPAEARLLFPAPEYIGIGMAVAALIAMVVKQGKDDGE